MTDNDIIKALECCKRPAGTGACKNCPLDKDRPCTTTMIENAIDLINRQKAEKETMQSYIDCLKAEIERLEKENRDIVYAYNIHITKPINHIKAEAVKEFAERLDRKFAFYYSDTQCISAKTIRESIQNELKEMVGENK